MARKSRKNNAVNAASLEPQPVFYNAAAYLRLSSDDKKKRGDSLETQREIIENFAAALPGVRVVEVYTDNNATGTNFDRPGFRRMLADAEAGRINCIIVKDLSRFGRNAIDAGYYIEKCLPALGVRFIAVTDRFDSNEGDGTSGIMLPLKNLISESYALDISRKCRSVQRQYIREGRFVGRMAPYGFAKDPADCRHLVPDPEAAAVVRRIFNWAAQGIGAGEITRKLNGSGVMPPSHYKRDKGLLSNEKLIGRPYWQRRVVASILRDQVYVGDMVQGKTRVINYKEVAVDPAEWVCVKNTHEPIICREQFDLVQNLNKKNAARHAAVPYSPHIFKGKVFCAHCGHPMHRHRQNKDNTYWYRCQSQWKYHKEMCFQVSVKESELKSVVMDTLRKQMEVILGGAIQLEREAESREGDSGARLREISGQLNDNGLFLKSLYENLVGGMITDTEFASMKADYKAKIEALSKSADEMRRRQRKQKDAARTSRNVAVAASEAVMEYELTAEIIDRLVDKVLVSHDKSFKVIFRFDDEFFRIPANHGCALEETNGEVKHVG